MTASTLPCHPLVLHTNAGEVTDNGDTIDIDGLERSGDLVWQDKEVTE
jgi:hypothetical protein